ncbi:helix-turn-helix transcriptional regulator [Actinoplanes sp. NPDC023936]|uniref:helix-turn-helix domain-containing protein n=1 Tax=Actinoplanes sp. NPDC023936 TaxID=3154910 RepID=UPI0033C346B3
MAPDATYDPSGEWRLLGQRLAGYRKAAGYTQRALAAHDRIHYGRSTIANVEIGRQSIGRAFWESCDAVLGTGGALADDYDHIARFIRRHRIAEIKTAGPGPDSAPLATESDQDNTMGVLRRTVLLALAAAGGTAFGSGLPDPADSRTVRARPPADVDHWEETVWEYGYSFLTTPHETLLTDLCLDQATVRRQLSVELGAGTSAALPLAAVAAQLTALMAYCSTNLGFTREAGHLWRFARKYADISQDDKIRPWVSGHEIMSGIYQERPLDVLAALADRATAECRSSAPSAGKAELLGSQAEVLSLLGRDRDAQDALEALAETYENLPGSVTGLRDSFFGWPEHRMHHARSFTSSMTGHTTDAFSAQKTALKLYPTTKQVSRCQINLHHARCLVLNGEISEGLRHAGDALDGVDLATWKVFVLAVADRITDAVPRGERRRADVREFGDLVRRYRSGGRQVLT